MISLDSIKAKQLLYVSYFDIWLRFLFKNGLPTWQSEQLPGDTDLQKSQKPQVHCVAVGL